MSTDPNPRLSLCMIVKDEIEHLEGCLDSVAGLVDEIVILDTGSTDGTWPVVQLRAHQSAQVVWPNHFAEARNQSIALATGDWILVMDADERLVAGGDAIRAAISRPTLLAGTIQMRNDMGDGKMGDFWALRLFRRLPDIRFEGRIHEQVAPSCEKRRSLEPEWEIGRVDCTILHLGYEPELFQSKGKSARNIQLLELALKELPEDAPIEKRVYLEYKLGAEIGSGRVGQGHMLRAANRLLEAGPDAQRRFTSSAELLVSASQAWRQGGNPEAALSAAEAALALEPKHPMPRLVRAQALLGLGRNSEAADALSAARMSESVDPQFFFDFVGYDIAAAVAEATIRHRTGDDRGAKMALQNMRAKYPEQGLAQLAWVHGLVQLDEASAALRAAVDYLKANPEDRGGLLACASAAEALGMHEKAARWRSKALG